jgi:hypothetical protein
MATIACAAVGLVLLLFAIAMLIARDQHALEQLRASDHRFDDDMDESEELLTMTR